RVLLSIHIAAGFTTLATALVAAVTRKGERAHVYAGRVFVLGMGIVFLTALPMTLIKPNLFLFLTAVFSFYLALTGWLRARNRADRGAPHQDVGRHDRRGHRLHGRQRAVRPAVRRVAGADRGADAAHRLLERADAASGALRAGSVTGRPRVGDDHVGF